jgi:hypothetical protein
MIDAPANFSGMISSTSLADRTMDRGYDFAGVVRWYADRADIVCLFFDPDKPGTTGETLSILLHALSGMDHKLLIVLNKADQFEKIHDFARAYGSLCWNLSKVIPRKDLPRIYTMCLPVHDNDKKATTATTTIPAALNDLHAARDEVVAEVRKAPERRMDNVITSLQDAVQQLHMHAVILQDIRNRWSKLYWQGKWTQLGVAGTGGGLTSAMVCGGSWVPVEITGAVLAATVLSTGILTWYQSTQLAAWEGMAKSPEELSAAFQRTHARAVQEGDESVAATWQRIRQSVSTALSYEGSIGNLATVTKGDLEDLQNILRTEIPRLRRKISPAHYGKEGQQEGED